MSRRPPFPLLAAAGLALLLAACIVGARADARGLVPGDRWPGVWQGPTTPTEATPPTFDPPSADDCHRPPALREVPGRSGDAQQDGPVGFLRDASPLERRAAAAKAVPAPAVPPAFLSAPSMSLAESPLARPQLQPQPQPQPQREVTAGMVDDNADFGAYLAYRQRHPGLDVHERDIGERYPLDVTDAAGRPVADAEVAVQRPNAPEPLMRARTDTAGRVWLHPRVFLPPEFAGERSLGVAVRKGAWQGRAVLRRGQASSVQVRLGGTPSNGPARLDLVFLVDATGSMGDEIAKLKASMRAMSRQIAELPSRPDICWGLVVYRDRGDVFLNRTMDFTDRLAALQEQLARVQAEGGGDMPEALNEALHETVHGLAWRRDAVRLVVLVADAPPHLDYGGPQYDVDMQAALGKGIKLFAVGASGLDPTGEYVFRQLAQYTAGRFVFLTYKDAANPGSGPGSETVHDVKGYSVQTLDRLVVRLVAEELGRLAAR